MSRLAPPSCGHGAASRGHSGVLRTILIAGQPPAPREPKSPASYSRTSVGNVTLTILLANSLQDRERTLCTDLHNTADLPEVAPRRCSPALSRPSPRTPPTSPGPPFPT